MSEQAGKIHAAMGAILAEFGGIAKGRTNAQQGYKFRGIADLALKAQPLMAKHGVYCIPRQMVTETCAEKQTKNGGTMQHVRVKVAWRFYHEDGSFVDTETLGEGMDSGDKATNKAMTGAEKYNLTLTFTVPEENPDDPDEESPEDKQQAAAQKPQPKPAPKTLPLSEEEEHKLANWLASLENRHGAEDLAIARKAADKLTSAVLKAKVLDAIERYAKRAAV